MKPDTQAIYPGDSEPDPEAACALRMHIELGIREAELKAREAVIRAGMPRIWDNIDAIEAFAEAMHDANLATMPHGSAGVPRWPTASNEALRRAAELYRSPSPHHPRGSAPWVVGEKAIPADEALAWALSTYPALDWSDLESDIADAISDSMDMDWTSGIGARAVVAMLKKLGARS